RKVDCGYGPGGSWICSGASDLRNFARKSDRCRRPQRTCWHHRWLTQVSFGRPKVGLPTETRMLMRVPMVRAALQLAEGGNVAAMESDESSGPAEMAPITGRVKWFDATRGFGFLVSDDVEGDVLLHFSVLREHGRRSVPEGAVIECIPVRLDRGLQAKRILSIDLST